MKNKEVLIRVEHHEAYNSNIILVSTPMVEFAVKTSLSQVDLEKMRSNPRLLLDLAMSDQSQYLDINLIRADRFSKLFSLHGYVVVAHKDDNCDVDISLLSSEKKDFIVTNWNFSKDISGTYREEMSGEHIYPLSKRSCFVELTEYTLRDLFHGTSHRTAASPYPEYVKDNKIIESTELKGSTRLKFVF